MMRKSLNRSMIMKKRLNLRLMDNLRTIKIMKMDLLKKRMKK